MDIIKIAKDVIQTEVDGLIHMGAHIDNSFIQAVNAILTTHGRTIICGMGKSGIVGKKLLHLSQVQVRLVSLCIRVKLFTVI